MEGVTTVSFIQCTGVERSTNVINSIRYTQRNPELGLKIENDPHSKPVREPAVKCTYCAILLRGKQSLHLWIYAEKNENKQ